MELIWGAVGIALAAVGLVELARVGLFWLLRPRRPGSAALVLLPRDGEDCELLIRAGVARLQWMGWPGCRLVCLNPGEDPNVEAICNIFQRRYPNLESALAEEKRTLLELCGSVEHVTYHNDKNQYTVLDLATEAGVVTVVGMFPFVSEGEELRVYGTWQSHPSFGDQFKAETFDRARPATTAAMLKYLSSGAVKGVGPATARRIIDTFGDKALEVMENDPQRLAQIKGITQEKAQEIGEELRRAYGIRELMMFLGTYGVRPEETVLVWKQYGEASVACIQEDPYCLCGEGIDISFDIADAIAESMEKPRDDMGRVQAGILYVLRHNLNNGHTCLPADKLTRAAAQILSVGPDVVQDGIYTLCEGFHLAAEEIDGQEFLFLQKQHASESYIAARMLAMLSMAESRASATPKSRRKPSSTPWSRASSSSPAAPAPAKPPL